jgi:hypothetical protein
MKCGQITIRRKLIMKIKNTFQLKRIISAFLLISALGLSIGAQTTEDDRSCQILGSGSRSCQYLGNGGVTSGGLIGSGTRAASLDSGSGGAIKSIWIWFESIF